MAAGMGFAQTRRRALSRAEQGQALSLDEVETLLLAQPGSQNAQEFDQTARDITAFLEYAGEPAALRRQNLGVWVILFLAFFTFLAWLLKKDYWRDVH